MTETVVLQRKTVSATGFANPLNLPANVEDETHVSVYGDDELLTLSADYTVEGAGDTGDLDAIEGVNIILDAEVLLLDYATYTVEHTPPLDQGVDLSSGGTLGRIYMQGLDAIVRRLQTIGAALGRRLVLPVDSDASPVLPTPEPRRALVWNAAGDALVNTGTDPDTEPVAQAFDAVEAALATLAAAEASLIEQVAAAEAARDAALAAQSAAEQAAAAAGDPGAIAAMGVPVGASVFFTHTNYPTSAFLKENGAVVSQAAYPALYAAIGDNYNTGGEGAGNFRLPESRGEFFRAWDDGRGVDTGRSLYAAQTEMIGPHAHTTSVSNAGSHSHTVTMNANARFGANGSAIPEPDFGSGDIIKGFTGRNMSVSTAGDHAHTVTVNNNSGTENRPRNVARLVAIKYAVYTPPP